MDRSIDKRTLLEQIIMPILLVIFLLFSVGCATPPEITKDGGNCEHYGVSESHKIPMGCPIGEDGFPVVTVLTTRELKDHCDNTGFFKEWSWGCVEQTDRGWQAVANREHDVQMHEACHCIWGIQHTQVQ